MQSQLSMAHEKIADLALQSQAQQEEAASKITFAEQQNLELQQQCSALQRAVKLAGINQGAADQVCLLVIQNCLTELTCVSMLMLLCLPQFSCNVV